MPSPRVVAAALVAAAACAQPTLGPYNVTSVIINVTALDATDPRAWVVYPDTTATATFPLVVYLHGLLGGDMDLVVGYAELFTQIAS